MTRGDATWFDIGAWDPENTRVGNTLYVSNSTAAFETVHVTFIDSTLGGGAVTAEVENVNSGESISVSLVDTADAGTTERQGVFQVIQGATTGGTVIAADHGDTIQVTSPNSTVINLTVDGNGPAFSSISPADGANQTSSTVTYGGTITDADSGLRDDDEGADENTSNDGDSDGITTNEPIAKAGGASIDIDIFTKLPAVDTAGVTDQSANATSGWTNPTDGFAFDFTQTGHAGDEFWHIEATDRAGNTSRTDADTGTAGAQNFVVTVDDSKPSAPTSLVRTTPDTDLTPTFTWNAASDANLDLHEVKMNGGAFGSVGLATTFTQASALSAGSHTIQVRGVDKAGNAGSIASLGFTLIGPTPPPTPTPTPGPTPTPTSTPTPTPTPTPNPPQTGGDGQIAKGFDPRFVVAVFDNIAQIETQAGGTGTTAGAVDTGDATWFDVGAWDPENTKVGVTLYVSNATAAFETVHVTLTDSTLGGGAVTADVKNLNSGESISLILVDTADAGTAERQGVFQVIQGATTGGTVIAADHGDTIRVTDPNGTIIEIIVDGNGPVFSSISPADGAVKPSIVNYGAIVTDTGSGLRPDSEAPDGDTDGVKDAEPLSGADGSTVDTSIRLDHSSVSAADGADMSASATASWTTTPAGFAFSFNRDGHADGDHFWSIVARDRVGNETTTDADTGTAGLQNFVFAVDTVPPGTPTSLVKTTPVSDLTPTFTWSAASDANLDRHEVKMDGGAFTSVGPATTFTQPTSLSGGSHTIQVRGVDKAGNVGPSASLVFSLIAPSLPGVAGPTLAGLAALLAVAFVWTARRRLRTAAGR